VTAVSTAASVPIIADLIDHRQAIEGILQIFAESRPRNVPEKYFWPFDQPGASQISKTPRSGPKVGDVMPNLAVVIPTSLAATRAVLEAR